MATIWDDDTLPDKVYTQLLKAGKACEDEDVMEVINTLKIVYDGSTTWTSDEETIDTRIRVEVLARSS